MSGCGPLVFTVNFRCQRRPVLFQWGKEGLKGAVLEAQGSTEGSKRYGSSQQVLVFHTSGTEVVTLDKSL